MGLGHYRAGSGSMGRIGHFRWDAWITDTLALTIIIVVVIFVSIHQDYGQTEANLTVEVKRFMVHGSMGLFYPWRCRSC